MDTLHLIVKHSILLFLVLGSLSFNWRSLVFNFLQCTHMWNGPYWPLKKLSSYFCSTFLRGLVKKKVSSAYSLYLFTSSLVHIYMYLFKKKKDLQNVHDMHTFYGDILPQEERQFIFYICGLVLSIFFEEWRHWLLNTGFTYCLSQGRHLLIVTRETTNICNWCMQKKFKNTFRKIFKSCH